MELTPFGVHFDFGDFGQKLRWTVLTRGLKPDSEYLGWPKILVQHSSRRSWKCTKNAFLVGEARERCLAFDAKKTFWTPFWLPFLARVRLGRHTVLIWPSHHLIAHLCGSAPIFQWICRLANQRLLSGSEWFYSLLRVFRTPESGHFLPLHLCSPTHHFGLFCPWLDERTK